MPDPLSPCGLTLHLAILIFMLTFEAHLLFRLHYPGLIA